MKYIGLVGLLVLSLGVASPSTPYCNNPPYEHLETPPPLRDLSLTLLAMGDADNLREVSQTPPVTLLFPLPIPEHRPEYRLQGSTGCNGYAGAYDNRGLGIGAGERTLRIVDLRVQERGCPTPDLFEREREYIDILTNAQVVTLVQTSGGQRLAVEAEDGRVLVFRRNLDFWK